MNKKFFLGYQITNLIFQLLLIPIVYKNFILSNIGVVLSYNIIAQILLIMIGGGSSVIGVTGKGKNNILIDESIIFRIQFIISSAVSFLFLLVSFYISSFISLNIIFFIYLLSSSIASYWLIVKIEEFKYLFVANIFTKALFLSSLFFMIKFAHFSESTIYALSIMLEYAIFNIVLLFNINIRAYFMTSLSSLFSLNDFYSYIHVSVVELIKSLSKDIDKIVLIVFATGQSIAIYNLVFKLADIPANLISQLNYTQFKKYSNLKYAKKLATILSVIAITLEILFFDYIVSFFVNNGDIFYFYELKTYILFFILLILIRSHKQIVIFELYHKSAFEMLQKILISYIFLYLWLSFLLKIDIKTILIITLCLEAFLVICIKYFIKRLQYV